MAARACKTLNPGYSTPGKLTSYCALAVLQFGGVETGRTAELTP